jgi:hypothetical protein
MRVSKLSFALAIISIFAAVGCGTGGSGSVTLNHMTGNFSNATLSGSYVYQAHGWASANGLNFVPYRQVGVFTADGNGHITAGSDDSSLGANTTAVTGSYNVVADGTGFITLNSSSLGIPLNFAITVANSSQIQLIENDAALNAGGTAELQDASAVGTTPSGTFVFRLHQEASAQNSSEGASQVGAFTLSGGAGTGAMDQNLNGAFTSPGVNVALNAPLGAGRGTGTLTDTSAIFTTDFTYYIVNSNKFVLLVSGGSATGSGSAETQSGSVSTGLSGTYAFGSRGDDVSTGIGGVATVGQFTSGSGSLSGTEDLMQDGTYTANQNFSSCFTVGAASGINGRVAAIANGSGACSGTPTQVFWMVSPARAFFIDNSGTTLEDGTADLQTTNSFSAATFKGQFATAMDGVDLVDNQLLSRVGALNLDGSNKATLSEDANGSSAGANQTTLSGSYSANNAGRVIINLTTNGGLNLVMYAVSGSQAYVLQQDAGVVTSGTVLLQH